MVMYRDFVARMARPRRIVGEVKNMHDGTVHLVAEGEEDALREYVALLHKGPILAHVEDVAVAWYEPKGTFDRFRIVYERP